MLPDALARLTEAVFYEYGSFETDAVTHKTIQFERLLRAIDEHLQDDELSAESLSRVLNVSRSTLYGITRVAGTTVERMVIDARLSHVASKLTNPLFDSVNLTDLAFSSGFQDLSHFSRRFKDKYGLAPAKYRQSRSMKH
jgi:AraC-like DNA-binding protein